MSTVSGEGEKHGAAGGKIYGVGCEASLAIRRVVRANGVGLGAEAGGLLHKLVLALGVVKRSM